MIREYSDLESAIDAIKAVEELGFNYKLERKEVEIPASFMPSGSILRTEYKLEFFD